MTEGRPRIKTARPGLQTIGLASCSQDAMLVCFTAWTEPPPTSMEDHGRCPETLLLKPAAWSDIVETRC